MIPSVESLTTEHESYTANLSTWVLVRDAYDGDVAIRRKIETYLPREPLEPQFLYEKRRNRALYIEIVPAVINEFVSFVLEEKPQIPDDRRPDGIEQLVLDDATLGGEPMDWVIARTLIWSLVYGHCFIFVDNTRTGIIARTEGDVRSANGAVIRPRIRIITPENVLNWRTTDGRFRAVRLRQLIDDPDDPFERKLEAFLYMDEEDWLLYTLEDVEGEREKTVSGLDAAAREIGDESVEELKSKLLSLRQGVGTTLVSEKSDTQARIIAQGKNPYGLVPMFRASVFNPSRSMAAPIARAALLMMTWMSAIDSGIRDNLFATLAIWTKSSLNEIGVGTNWAIKLDPGDRETGEPREDITYIRPGNEAAIAATWDSLDRMTALVNRIISLEHTDMLVTSLQDVSGRSREFDFKKTGVSLVAMADAAERIERKIWEYVFAVRQRRYPTPEERKNLFFRRYNKEFRIESLNERLQNVVALINIARRIPSPTARVQLISSSLRSVLNDISPETMAEIRDQLEQAAEELSRMAPVDGPEAMASMIKNETNRGSSAERMSNTTEK